ncbi:MULTISPECIES: hypothetical protein [Actinomadura]|uniref:Uncharacterized protein n=1 Tax=Actinomadura yumaensis TaxID=111807 RepID=A0ABW2CPR5_9ACTN|nr:hypothetical protein [Actinomadura sp. J1-007]MWK40423.1 hypothetical protein [Actinomadura sp. J1-007]
MGQTRGRTRKGRYDSAEAEALGVWVVGLVHDAGLTVRALEARFRPQGGPGKSLWTEYLNGTKLIPLHYLELLVRGLVREPRRQEALLAEGRELWGRAERAAAGKPSAQDRKRLTEQERLRRLEQEHRDRESDLRQHLEDAQRDTIQAQDGLLTMNRLVSVLLVMNVTLSRRWAELERRHQATVQELEGHRQELRTAEVQNLSEAVETLRARCAELESRQDASLQELRYYQDRLREADRQLTEARRRQDEAEALRQEAVERVTRYRRELAQGDAPAATDGPEPPEPGSASSPRAGAPLEEYDAALEQSTAVLQETGRSLAELRRRLELDDPPSPRTPSSDGPRIVRGQLADNGESPADPVDSVEDGEAFPKEADLAEDEDEDGGRGGDGDGDEREPEQKPERAVLMVSVFAGAMVLVISSVFTMVAFALPDVPLTYRSGDRPRQRTISHNGDANSGVPAATWTTGPAGRVDTTWSAAPSADIRALNGSLTLVSPEHGEDGRCPKAIGGVRMEWAVRLDGAVVAAGTIRADLEVKRLHQDKIKVTGGSLATGKARGRPHLVRLTARRVDSTPCKADLAWKEAALDNPGFGPPPWQPPHPLSNWL